MAEKGGSALVATPCGSKHGAICLAAEATSRCQRPGLCRLRWRLCAYRAALVAGGGWREVKCVGLERGTDRIQRHADYRDGLGTRVTPAVRAGAAGI